MKKARHWLQHHVSGRYYWHDSRRLRRGPEFGSKPGFTTAHSGVQKEAISRPMVSRLYRDDEPYLRLLMIAGATQLELARHLRYLRLRTKLLRKKLPSGYW